MEGILSGMLRHRRILSNQLKRLSGYVEIMKLGVIHPPLTNFDFCGGEYFSDSCHLYSMENYWWEQEGSTGIAEKGTVEKPGPLVVIH
ncbi:hypothetical protein JHK85_034525 [Glycine max]|nr:hypothetical protein JHK85_034525 [Glycine max]